MTNKQKKIANKNYKKATISVDTAVYLIKRMGSRMIIQRQYHVNVPTLEISNLV